MSQRRFLCAIWVIISLPMGFACAETNTPTAQRTPAEPEGNVSSPSVAEVFNDPDAARRKAPKPLTEKQLLAELTPRLEMARQLRRTKKPAEAEAMLIELLGETTPATIKGSALLELAQVAQDDNQDARAQQIYAQFLDKWPDDPRAPEVLLRQGQVFRKMGLNTLALTKFYGVMTSALVLKNDKLEYYQRLVLQAQTEIAESHYQLGNYTEAADFFGRLLKQNNPALDRPEAQFRLIHSLSALGRNDEVVVQAKDFVSRYPDATGQPEVRFYLALAFKHLTQNEESLRQVLVLLQEQKARTAEHPELWGYWQQRAGNEIANQLYREGDYPRALDVYLSLAKLDSSPAWQLPVLYQIAMTYERLLQPEKATQIYRQITDREKEAGGTASPGLKAVFDMARWRANFLDWQKKAEASNRSLSFPTAGTAVPVQLPAKALSSSQAPNSL